MRTPSILLSAGLFLALALNGFAQSLSTVRFAAAEYVVEEGQDAVTLTVERIGPPDGTASVDFSTADGYARNGTDYLAQSGNLYFVNETNLSIVIPILTNPLLGCGRTFYVTLSNPDPFDTELGEPASVQVTIQPCSVYRFSTNRFIVSENAGTVAVSVERTSSASRPSWVSFSTAFSGSAQPGQDYVHTSSELLFAPGETNKSVIVPILDNALLDPTRFFAAWLVGASDMEGGFPSVIAQAVVTIHDDDCDDACIEDPVVFQAIRAAVGKLDQPVTIADLESLRELEIIGGWPKVNSLGGLGALRNLAVLRLKGSYPNCGGDLSCGLHPLPDGIDVSYFEPLSSLQHLTTLDLSLNLQTNFALPSSLFRLTNLVLAGNRLTDLSFLRPLTNLAALDLSAGTKGRGFGYEWVVNEVEDYSPLADLPNLRTLTVRNATLTNLDFGVLDIALETLDLSGNQLSDVGFLQRCPELKWLDLSGNQGSNALDMSVLGALPQLTHLALQFGVLTNLTFGIHDNALKTLDVSGNQLSDVGFLQRCPELKWLDLSGNRITESTDFLPMTRLSKLDVLLMNGVSIWEFFLPAELRGLSQFSMENSGLYFLNVPPEMTNLVTLELGGNHLGHFADFYFLNGLTRLTTLDLAGNELLEFSLPAALKGLSTLELGHNQIFDHVTLSDSLADMTNLAILDLAGNGLPEFNIPPGTSNLTTLRLNGNQLSDISAWPALPRLTTLDLSRNSFTTISIPPAFVSLTLLDLSMNQLIDFTLSPALISLETLNIANNQLTGLSLLDGLERLVSLDVSANPLSRLSLPNGLGRLSFIWVYDVPFVIITLAPDINPQATIAWRNNQSFKLIVPETHAYAAYSWPFLNVYPLAVSLSLSRPTPNGTMNVTLNGPPGTYTVLHSTNLNDWTAWNTVTNELGRVIVAANTAAQPRQHFFRARRTP